MGSSLVQGAIGLIIVMSVLVGGMMAASICHHTLTPNIGPFYMVWLWIWLIPFWWLSCTSLVFDHIKHPIATYVGFLPFLLLMSMLIVKLGPGNPWVLPVMLVTYFAYFLVLTAVRKVWSIRR